MGTAASTPFATSSALNLLVPGSMKRHGPTVAFTSLDALVVAQGDPATGRIRERAGHSSPSSAIERWSRRPLRRWIWPFSPSSRVFRSARASSFSASCRGGVGEPHVEPPVLGQGDVLPNQEEHNERQARGKRAPTPRRSTTSRSPSASRSACRHDGYADVGDEHSPLARADAGTTCRPTTSRHSAPVRDLLDRAWISMRAAMPARAKAREPDRIEPASRAVVALRWWRRVAGIGHRLGKGTPRTGRCSRGGVCSLDSGCARKKEANAKRISEITDGIGQVHPELRARRRRLRAGGRGERPAQAGCADGEHGRVERGLNGPQAAAGLPGGMSTAPNAAA